ncbi:MAG TPA: toll/interleukin-1 receptor domain-containing protein [Isosphaeraceae bacterium]|nr:toll/interleukin-1 receptor domain-containing protein [Isosphaeraceae bacterium]
MSRIFISYRRTDSADQAGRIFDRLVAAFSRGTVFKDVDSVPAGADFRKVIEEAVQRAEIVILIIGPSWLSAVDESGHRRLDDQNDFVRLELESALRQGKLIIPVIVRGGTMPRSSELPETVTEVAFRHAVSVRPDPDFHRDMDRLIEAIKARKAERHRTGPPPRMETLKWATYALAILGLLIATIVTLSFFPGRRTQGPDRPEPKSPKPLIQAKGAYPEGKPNALPFPAAPSKTLPASIPDGRKAAPETKIVQTNPPRPSLQSPAVQSPAVDEAPPAPPAPPAPAPRGSGSLWTPKPGKEHHVAQERVTVRKTMPRSDAESSEEVPPPPLIPIPSRQRSS